MRKGVLTLASLAIILTGQAGRAAEEDWIKRRVEAVKASESGAWRKIPWVSSLLAARRVSEEEKAPIFLYTHDGNIDTGRC